MSILVASYDLSKLRGKALVQRVEHGRRYRPLPYGVRILAAMLVLREHVIKPVLSGLRKFDIARPPKKIHPLDQHYQALPQEMRRTFQPLGLGA